MKKSGQCVYCGEIKELTEDHIPPKNLFPISERSNLIKINCCYDCNNNATQDDEYFRNLIVMREDVFENIEAKKIFQNIIRSFLKPEQIKFRNKFINLNNVKKVYSQLGLYLGEKYIFKVDYTRLKKVVERITKGLFYIHSNNNRLDENYSIFILFDKELDKIYSDKIKYDKVINFVENLKNKINYNDEIIVVNNIFKYRYYIFEENNNVSIWLYMFYDKLFVLSITMNKAI